MNLRALTLKNSLGLTAAGTLTFAVYALTLSRHYSADSVLYALRIEGWQPGQLLDPTHLLIEPMAVGWYRLWQGLGWQGDSLVPLQVINALGGAASATLLYVIGRRLSGSRTIGGIVALGFAVSGGLWLLSVEAEFVTVPLAWALLVLWLILAPPRRLATHGLMYATVLGAVLTLAILFYLNGIMLVFVAATGLMVQEGHGRRERIEQLVAMLLAVGLVCLPIGLALLDGRSWSQWANQIWQNGGSGYTAVTWLDGPHGGYAFLRTLALFPGQAMNDSGRAFLAEAGWGERLLFGLFYAAVLGLALAPFVLAVRMRKLFWTRYRRETLVLLVWAVLYGAFAIYWVPGDISFWVPMLTAWWLLVAMVAAIEIDNERKQERAATTKPWLAMPIWPLIALVVALAVVNAVTVIWPRHNLATNTRYWLAKQVASQTSTDDLIITDGEDLITLYLVYFGRRTVLPVADLGRDESELVESFGRYLEDTRVSGGQTFVLRDEKLVSLTR